MVQLEILGAYRREAASNINFTQFWGGFAAKEVG
jgi:hypothetical protein